MAQVGVGSSRPARMLTVMSVALGLHAGGAGATTPPPYVEVVVENPDYETLAVDSSGMTYGKSMTDETESGARPITARRGRTVLALPVEQAVVSISALASGTLLAHVDTGSTHLQVDRPGRDLGERAHPAELAVFYTTLTSDSIADGDGFVWLGTYNTGPSARYENYIYRSADDGLTGLW